MALQALLLDVPSIGPVEGMHLLRVRDAAKQALQDPKYDLAPAERILVETFIAAVGVVTEFSVVHQRVVIDALSSFLKNPKEN